MSPATSTPDTIVLVHGFWVTPRSWEHWIDALRGQGLPRPRARLPRLRGRGRGAQRRPDADRGASRSRRSSSTSRRVVGELDAPPIIIGHSAGGVFTQILLDHGFGAAGVAINSAPTEGVKARAAVAGASRRSRCSRTRPTATAPSASRSSSGTTRSPTRSARRSPGGSTSATTSRRPARSSGAACWPTSIPGHDDTWVDYHNDARAPLLFISGSEDHLMPPKIQQSNAKHYKSDTVTEVKEFDGPHLLPARAGLGGGRRLRPGLGARARGRSRAGSVTDVRLTHVGGPTVLDRGRRLAAARPTRRSTPPAGGTPSAGAPSSRKLAGPAIAAADIGPIDAVLLTHDHHADNLDDAGRALLPSAGAVVTTAPGARRLGGRRPRPRAVGRRRGSRRRAGRRSRSRPRRAATGPPHARSIVGDVIGFALRWDGQDARRAVDLRRHRPLRRRARGRRAGVRVDTALLHLGAVRFPVTGPAALHDDRPRRRRAVPADPPAHGRPGPLRGLEALPRGPGRDRARVRRRAGGAPAQRALAAARRGSRLDPAESPRQVSPALTVRRSAS